MFTTLARSWCGVDMLGVALKILLTRTVHYPCVAMVRAAPCSMLVKSRMANVPPVAELLGAAVLVSAVAMVRMGTVGAAIVVIADFRGTEGCGVGV